MIVKTDPDAIVPYTEDYSNLKGTPPEKVIVVENEQEIIEVIKEAASKKIPLTISGAGTGNVGGRVPMGGWVLSTEKLNKIIEIDRKNMCATLEAGVRIADFLHELESYNLFYAPFPTEKSAFIGGNAATNASGEFSYRFGCTRGHILGLRVVLSTGEILDIKRGKIVLKNGTIQLPGRGFSLKVSYRSPDIHKNSAGYYLKDTSDLIDLLIGNEGTLGVISQVKVKLTEMPKELAYFVAFYRTENPSKPVNALKNEVKFKNHMFVLEYFDKNSLNLLKQKFPQIPADAEYALLFAVEMKKDWLKEVLEFAEKFDAIDVWASESRQDAERILDMRHALPETINSILKNKKLKKLSTDIAVPHEKFWQMFEFYKKTFENCEMLTVMFGHIGESHLHTNLIPNPEQIKEAENVIIKLMKKGVELGGTISAEHGIGKTRKKYLSLMFSDKEIQDMKKIKEYFDPSGILCPGNIF